MSKKLSLLDAVLTELLECRLFQFVPAHGNPFTLEILPDGVFGIGAKAFKSWTLTIDDKTSITHLRLFTGENELRADLTLHTSTGVWSGRDREGGRGTCQLRPINADHNRWLTLANPTKFFRSLSNVDEKEPNFQYREALPPQLEWESHYVNLAKELNVEKLKGDRSNAIAIVGYNRPNYLYQTITSLAANPEAGEWPVFAFLDHSDKEKDRDAVNEQARMLKGILPGCVIVRRPVNFGCGRNIIDVHRQLFDNLGYDRVWLFEDDLVVTPEYLGLCSRLFDWASEQWNNIGAVQGWAMNLKPAGEKLRYRRVVHPTFGNWWGYCQNSKSWTAMRDDIYDYEKLFLGGSYGRRPHKSIVEWFRSKVKKGGVPIEAPLFDQSEALRQNKGYWESPPTGQDAAMMWMFRRHNFVRLALNVNRGHYIGRHGIHMNPRWYEAHGFGRHKLDLMPGDDSLSDFAFVPDDVPEMLVVDEADPADVPAGFDHIKDW